MLVDEHFRTRKRVQDYAELLHRSPKTLSNLFAACGHASPLSVIHDRVNAEARRLLPDAETHALKSAGHFPMETHSCAIRDDLRGWIRYND